MRWCAFFIGTQHPVGAGLPAMAVCQSAICQLCRPRRSYLSRMYGVVLVLIII